MKPKFTFSQPLKSKPLDIIFKEPPALNTKKDIYQELESLLEASCEEKTQKKETENIKNPEPLVQELEKRKEDQTIKETSIENCNSEFEIKLPTNIYCPKFTFLKTESVQNDEEDIITKEDKEKQITKDKKPPECDDKSFDQHLYIENTKKQKIENFINEIPIFFNNLINENKNLKIEIENINQEKKSLNNLLKKEEEKQNEFIKNNNLLSNEIKELSCNLKEHKEFEIKEREKYIDVFKTYIQDEINSKKKEYYDLLNEKEILVKDCNSLKEEIIGKNTFILELEKNIKDLEYKIEENKKLNEELNFTLNEYKNKSEIEIIKLEKQIKENQEIFNVKELKLKDELELLIQDMIMNETDCKNKINGIKHKFSKLKFKKKESIDHIKEEIDEVKTIVKEIEEIYEKDTKLRIDGLKAMKVQKEEFEKSKLEYESKMKEITNEKKTKKFNNIKKKKKSVEPLDSDIWNVFD